MSDNLTKASQRLFMAASRLRPSERHIHSIRNYPSYILTNLGTTVGALRELTAALDEAAPLIRASLPLPIDVETER